MKCAEIKHEWQLFQDNVVRHVLGHMGYRRMTDKDLCKAAKVSKSVWGNIKNLRYPAKLETMVKVAMAVELRLNFTLEPRHIQRPSKAFSIWTHP